MTEDNPIVVAAELCTPPVLKKLARAYIALARQLGAPAAATVPIATNSTAGPDGAAR